MNMKELCLSGNCTSNESHQRFRVYQLILSAGKVIPFAFKRIDALYKADYK